MHERTSAAATQGQAIALLPMKIIAYGTVCATLDPRRDERCRFEIPEGTLVARDLVRRCGREPDSGHSLDRLRRSKSLPRGRYTILLQGGRQLALSVMPASEPDGQAGQSRVHDG